MSVNTSSFITQEEYDNNLTDAIEKLPEFTPKLQNIIAKILPEVADDPYYAPNFDPVAFINAQFPTEESLGSEHISTYLTELREDIADLSEDIRDRIHLHAMSREASKLALDASVKSIGMLSKRIRELKELAEPSEKMVLEINADITGLDYAKQHLQRSISSLRHLHMLLNALSQVRVYIDQKKYHACATLLNAIKTLQGLFHAYNHVEKMRVINSQIQIERSRLQEQVFVDLDVMTVRVDLSGEDTQTLRDACAVLTELDVEVKWRFFSKFLKFLTEPYKNQFGIGKDGATLDQIPRRFSWLRREIRRVADVYSEIIPVKWGLSFLFALSVCASTRKHQKQLFRSTSVGTVPPSPTETLPSVMEALTISPVINKEKESSLKTFASSLVTNLTRKAESEETLSLTDFTEAPAMGPSEQEINHVWAALFRASECEHELTQFFGTTMERVQNHSEDIDRDLILRGIRSLLENDDEVSHPLSLVDVFSSVQPCLLLATRRVLAAGNTTEELLLLIKQSLTQCAKINSHSLLSKLWTEYTYSIHMAAIKTLTPCAVLKGSEASLEMVPKLAEAQTAIDYLSSVVPTLCANAQKRVSEIDETTILSAEAVLQVLDEAAQALYTMIMKPLSKLVQFDTYRLMFTESFFVEDVHSMVKTACSAVKIQCAKLSLLLPVKFHAMVVSNLGVSLIQRLHESVSKMQTLTPVMCQQMLLDTYHIKAMVTTLQLQTIDEFGEITQKTSYPNKASQRIYGRLVTKRTGQLEAWCKILSSPADMFIQTTLNLMPNIETTEIVELARLRGATQQESTQYLNQWLQAQKASQQPNTALEE